MVNMKFLVALTINLRHVIRTRATKSYTINKFLDEVFSRGTYVLAPPNYKCFLLVFCLWNNVYDPIDKDDEFKICIQKFLNADLDSMKIEVREEDDTTKEEDDDSDEDEDDHEEDEDDQC